MTEQARPQLSDTLIERMLIERAGPGAPADLVHAIATAVKSTDQRASGLRGAVSGSTTSRTRRGPRRTWLLVAATLLVGTGVIGASIVGGRLIAPNPSPTDPNAVVNASASPSPDPGASIVPYKAASWTGTGSMTTPRQQQAATLLPDGNVLVVGGYHATVPSRNSTADVYDPSSGTWTVTGRMTEDRLAGLTATLLRDGKVLVAGGQRGWTPSAGDGTFASAELYDPATGRWTATGSMTTPRMGHTATLLSDGRVLVAGGEHYAVGSTAGGTLASAELYDPATGTWTATGSMTTPRSGHTAVLLPNGQVLVVGGGTTAELYDPGTGRWTATGSMATARGWYTATLLNDGKVLVAGGSGGSIGTPAGTLASAELYDPGTGTWVATGSMGTPRAFHTATLLPDGRVLIAAGASVLRWGGDTLLASAELYDPSTGTWTATASMVAPRQWHMATLLPDGRVLVAGGEGGARRNEWQPTAELFDPGDPAPSSRPAAVVAYIKYIYRTSQMAQTGRVWIVGTDGRGAHELFPGGTDAESGVAWSPDGSWLIYQVRPGPGELAGKVTVPGLYLINASGSAPQVVDPDCFAPCSDTSAAFSPDGTQLVFVRGGATRVIATMDLAGGRVVELSSTAAGYSERPRWSPDGKRIVFSSQDKFGNGSAVFVVDADGRNLRQLSPVTLPARLPDWSPDGSRIVFTSLVITYVQVGGTNVQKMSQDVYTVRPDWADLRRLTTDENSIGATWTPDARILFSTGCRGDCAATGGLWIMDADGSDAKLLVPGGSGLDAPLGGIDAAWQPTP
jgi:Tol biopolymer transport system component